MSAISHKVLGADGRESGSVELEAAVFDCKVSENLVHDTVVWQRNKKRAGTHSALTKAEVSGGGKKPWKQKGTGQARAGSNTSPLWVGGGVIHGPKPRDYTTRLSKRARRQALCSALTFKRQSNVLLVVDGLVAKEGRTKEIVEVLKKLGIEGQKAMILVSCTKGCRKDAKKADRKEVSDTEKLLRASRNIPGVKTISNEGLNVYDLLKYKYLIATKEAISELQTDLKG